MPGPRPTPTSLKLIRGNPGRRPIRAEPEPAVPAELPEAPEFLNGYAKDEWYRVGQELLRLGLLTVADVQHLAAYCQAYGRWRTAEETLAKIAEKDPVTYGLLVKTRDGNPIPNPLVNVAEKAAAAMVRYGAEFGLTPAARSRVSTADSGATESKFGPLLLG